MPVSHAARAVIGIDCATQSRKVGLVRARLHDGTWSIEEATCGSTTLEPARLVTDWLTEVPETLLALDAPLGWPRALRQGLVRHRAGEPVPQSADVLFKRVTDRHVKECYNQNPLEVGANLIARTALAALDMLDEVRRATGQSVPLAWSPGDPVPAAIEVYPAATLRAHDPHAPALARESRDALIRSWIGSTFSLEQGVESKLSNGHVRDAALCALAALDFLDGSALPPHDEETAHEEGWIWVRAPS